MGGILERADLEQPAADGTTPGFIPTSYAQEIIKEAAKSSMVLSTFRGIRIPTKSNSIPVLNAFPTASWVAGEPTQSAPTAGKKAATDQMWKGVVVTAEEIAAIVVIPEAVIEDSTINLWSEITPAIAESIGAALDFAAFGGAEEGAPASFGPGILRACKTAGNNVESSAPSTSGDYNLAFGDVEEDGFVVRNVYAALNQKAIYRGWNASGIPTYLTDVRDDGRVDSIHGVPIVYDEFGALVNSTAFDSVDAVVGDATKAVVGHRTDMQLKVLTEATVDISAAQDGSAMVNLAQQDAVALRVRARFGIAVANPVTRANTDEGTRYPFATLGSATIE